MTHHKNNIAWIDLLRVIACILVVIAHSCDPYVAQFDNDRTSFLNGAFIGSLMRSSVPLFVMITGVLILPVKLEMATFYRKKISRILIPLAFWSAALPIMYFTYFQFATTASPAVSGSFTPEGTWTKIYTFIFNFNYDTTPLWYLYMLIGLYLIMPVINGWLKNATQKDVKLFLYIWAVSLTLPYIQMLAPVVGYAGNYGDMGILGNCTWNAYGTLYYMSGFLGYIVLAYYLTKYPVSWNLKKTLTICVPIFIVGYAITALGFILTQKYYPGNFAELEIVWFFSGINVAMMTIPLFIIMQKLPIKPSKTLAHLASCTFGIYLCHFVFVQMGYDIVKSFGEIPVALQILLITIIATIASYIVVMLLKLTKITSKVVN